MNYICIDKKKGRWGIIHGRRKVQAFTDGNISKNQLDYIFNEFYKPASNFYIDDRFIIIPAQKPDMIYTDESGLLVSYLT